MEYALPSFNNSKPFTVTIAVTFEPEGRTILYPLDWLAAHSYDHEVAHAPGIGWLSESIQTWDSRLNAAYKDVRAKRTRSDQIETESPSQVEALKLMQRAWIVYRDATCAYERSHWFGGTGGGPATVSCLMYMTAEQALYLEADGIVE